jgi:hypothetical protein
MRSASAKEKFKLAQRPSQAKNSPDWAAKEGQGTMFLAGYGAEPFGISRKNIS